MPCPQDGRLAHEEVPHFIELNRLMGQGLGCVDVHLLASARLAGLPLWTLDRPLHSATTALRKRLTHGIRERGF
jgi:hypothetical protein